MPEKIPTPVVTIKNADNKPDSLKAESWREAPYLKLENELSRIKDVEDLIEQYGENGLLGDKIKSYYDTEILKNSEVEVSLNKLEALQGRKAIVWSEIGVTETQIEELSDDDVLSDEHERLYLKLESLEEEYSSICQNVEDLQQDPDVLFFRKLKDGIYSLWYRFRDMERCKEDPAKFIAEEAKQYSGMPYEEVIYTDVSVTYVVSAEVWDEYVKKPSTLGIHRLGTVISIVKRNPDTEREESTIDHENRHALFEVFFGQEKSAVFDVQDTSRLKEKLIKLVGKGLPQESIEDEFQRFQESIWQKYLSGIKNEIIANFEGLKNGLFSSDFNIYVRIFETLQWQGVGAKIDKMLEGMNEQDKAEFLQTQEFFKTQFDKTSNRLKAECQKFYRDLADLFYWAEKENLTEELNSAMLLFDPLDYKKIKQYLTWKIGREKTGTYQALRRIVRSPFFREPKVAEPVGGDLDSRVIDAIKKRKAFEDDKVVQAMILEVPADAYSAENIEKISLEELRVVKLTEEEKVAFEEGANKYFFEGDAIHPSLLEKEPQYISEYIDKFQSVCSILEITLNMRKVREKVWVDYVYHKTEELLGNNDEEGLVYFLRSIDINERPYLPPALLGVKEILEERSQYNEHWEAILQELRTLL